MAQRRRGRRAGTTRWPSAVVYTLCAFYAATAAWLMFWAFAPVVVGLRPMVIVSDSMAPLIRSGDIVMVGRPTSARLSPGTVITFEDPGVPGRLLTHRIASRNGDGTYQTKGDANGVADSTAVAPERIRGVGRLLVPVVGLPIRLVLSGRWLIATVWAAGTTVAVAYVRLYPRYSSLQMWGWSSPQVRRTVRVVAPARRRLGAGWSRRVTIAGGAAGLVLAVVFVVANPAVSSAAWSAAAQNTGNTLTAKGCFPRTVTVAPTADTVVRQTMPDTTAGTGTSIAVQSEKNGNWRSFVRFSLPTDIGTCSIAATLRVYLHTGVGGRAVVATRATAAWGETTVTWNTQPPVGVTAATSAPFTAVGWIPLDVSSIVVRQYAEGNNGFRLHDSVEGATGGAQTSYFYSREGTYPPELVLTLS